jgi:hypothetical protein
MKLKARLEPKPRASLERDSLEHSLANVGHALARSVRRSVLTRNSVDEAEALQLLVAVYSFMTLVPSEEVHTWEVVDALGALHGAAFLLCERYPDLRRRVAQSMDDEGAVRYEACPF